MKTLLLAETDPLRALKDLNDVFLPAVVARMNASSARRLIGIYGGERVPENERNLTDIRTRIGLLLEHALVTSVNELLHQSEMRDLFLSNVVANRFPDLEVRNQNGERGLRFEVKALQTVAEEKSANFSTLKKDLSPDTDFVIVFLWEWAEDNDTVGLNWDRAPKIVKAFALHASSLAELRDFTWLNSPPTNLGANCYQGFDLLEAVTAVNGEFKKEENNLGKLLRIWDRDKALPDDASAIVVETHRIYLELEELAIVSGFQRVAESLATRSGFSILIDHSRRPDLVVTKERVGFVLGRKTMKSQLSILMSENKLRYLVYFSEKYSWQIYTPDGDRVRLLSRGAKPKLLKWDLL